MRAVKIELAGQAYYLLYNGAAMFAVEEVFGGVSALLEQMQGAGRGAFAAACKAAALLAEQGELARRAMGYENGPLLSEEDALVLATPLDAAALRSAVSRAIVAGYGRQVEGEDDTDLGLVELEQKKTKK